MEKFVKGDVVVVPFPFSDLTQAKRRPASVVSALRGEGIILCQITSKAVKDDYGIAIEDGDFESGTPRQSSSMRPNRIFTTDGSIALYKVGHLKSQKLHSIIEKLIEIVKE